MKGTFLWISATLVGAAIVHLAVVLILAGLPSL